MDDFRFVEQCDSYFEDVKNGKKELKEKIFSDHPRVKNLYRWVKTNSEKSYKKDFVHIYKKKCAYCGVSIEVVPIDYFQIDHFVPIEQWNDPSEVNDIDNLVLACQRCNHNKGDFYIDDKQIRDKVFPDNSDFIDSFVRDKDYYIVVSDKAKKHQGIIDFYNRLRLHDEVHRLDYLLMRLKKLENNEKVKDDPELKCMLQECENRIQEKRNWM